jgi:hypothetical protein
MEILGHKEFKFAKALFDELFSDVLDCDVGMGSNPNLLIGFGVVVTYDRGCDNRGFASSGRTLDYDDSIVVLIRQYPLHGCALRVIEVTWKVHRKCTPFPFGFGPHWSLLRKPQGLKERIRENVCIMLEGLEDDVLASGFSTSGFILSNGRDGDNLVALNGSIDTDAGAPPINFAGSPGYLVRSTFTPYFDLDNLCNAYIRPCIVGRTLANLIF